MHSSSSVSSFSSIALPSPSPSLNHCAEVPVWRTLPPAQLERLQKTTIHLTPFNRREFPTLVFTLAEIDYHLRTVLSSVLKVDIQPLAYGTNAGHKLGGPPGNDWDLLVALHPRLESTPLWVEEQLRQVLHLLVNQGLKSQGAKLPPDISREYALVCKRIPHGSGWVCNIGFDLDIVCRFDQPCNYSAFDAFYISVRYGTVFCLQGKRFTSDLAWFNQALVELQQRVFRPTGFRPLGFLRLLHHWAHGARIDCEELRKAYAQFKVEDPETIWSAYAKHHCQHFPDPLATLIDALNLLTIVQENPKECLDVATKWFRADPGSAFGALRELITKHPKGVPTFLAFIRGCLLYAYCKQPDGEGPMGAWIFPSQIVNDTHPRNFFSFRCEKIPRFLALTTSSRVISPAEVLLQFLNALDEVTNYPKGFLDHLARIVEMFTGGATPFADMDTRKLGVAVPEFVGFLKRAPLQPLIAQHFVEDVAIQKAVYRWLQHTFGPSDQVSQQLACLDIRDHLSMIYALKQEELAQFLQYVITCGQNDVQDFENKELADINAKLKRCLDNQTAIPIAESLKSSVATIVLPRINRALKRCVSHADKEAVVTFIELAVNGEWLTDRQETTLRRHWLNACMGCPPDYEDPASLKVILSTVKRSLPQRDWESHRALQLCPIPESARQKTMEAIRRRLCHPLQSALFIYAFRAPLDQQVTLVRTSQSKNVLQDLARLAVGCAALPGTARRQEIAEKLITCWPRIEKVFETIQDKQRAMDSYQGVLASTGSQAKLRGAIHHFQTSNLSHAGELGWQILAGASQSRRKPYKASALHAVLMRLIAHPAILSAREKTRLDDLLARLLDQPSPSHFVLVRDLFSLWKPPLYFTWNPAQLVSLQHYLEALCQMAIGQRNLSLMIQYHEFAKATFPKDQYAQFVHPLKQYVAREMALTNSSENRSGDKVIAKLMELLALYTSIAPEEAQAFIAKLVEQATRETWQLLSKLLFKADSLQLFQSAISLRKRVGKVLLSQCSWSFAFLQQHYSDGWEHFTRIHTLPCPQDSNDLFQTQRFGIQLILHTLTTRSSNGTVDLDPMIRFWKDYWTGLTLRPETDKQESLARTRSLLIHYFSAAAMVPVKAKGIMVEQLKKMGVELPPASIEDQIWARLSSKEQQLMGNTIDWLCNTGSREELENARDSRCRIAFVDLILEALHHYCVLAQLQQAPGLNRQELMEDQHTLLLRVDWYVNHAIPKKMAESAKQRLQMIATSFSDFYGNKAERVYAEYSDF